MVLSKRLLISISVACVILFVAFGAYECLAPSDFPSGSIVVISQGSTAPKVADQLTSAHVIKYATALEIILKISGQSAHIQAGAYLFKEPVNVFSISRRLAAGDYGIPSAKITLPEGLSVREMGEKLAPELPFVSSAAFVTAAEQYEGYLFPDTYSFSPSTGVSDVIKTLRANFGTKTAVLAADIAASGRSKADIITMASLLEKEARTEENRRLVAGVLWNRINQGMPLQVDAVFGYIFNRDTYSPSFADLKTPSPYNLYLHTGLPPTPINNPGLEAINDALHPTPTKYLYYLTGSDDQMHYATNYAEHQANQKKYLGK